MEPVFVSDDACAAKEQMLQQGLDAHSREAGLPSDHDLGEYCQVGDRMVGGVTGQVVGDRLLVRNLWVAPGHRQQGIAGALMARLEKRAAGDKCKVAFVNTYGFQAPGFYRKCGYAEVARITDYFAGHDRIFYRKELT